MRWYFRYRLSAADVRDLLAERHIDVSARTVLVWAHKFGPLLAAEGRRHARPIGSRWWADSLCSPRTSAAGWVDPWARLASCPGLDLSLPR